MFDIVRALLRDPLLHFFVAGAGLFLLFSFVSGPDMTGDEQIVVSSGQIEHMVSIFEKTRQRSPSEDELQGLIDNFILEEVLYREATAIGLDKDDTIIRRRLKQKMEFLVDDFSAAEPSDDELQHFLDANPERYRADARISFEHIYFADSPPTAVPAMLKELQSGATTEANLGDASGLLPQRFENESESAISGQFGARFKNEIFAIDTERWTGPVESPFGLHLIRISHISEGHVPPLADIRKELRRDWLANRSDEAQKAFFDQLRARYVITVEKPANASR